MASSPALMAGERGLSDGAIVQVGPPLLASAAKRGSLVRAGVPQPLEFFTRLLVFVVGATLE